MKVILWYRIKNRLFTLQRQVQINESTMKKQKLIKCIKLIWCCFIIFYVACVYFINQRVGHKNRSNIVRMHVRSGIHYINISVIHESKMPARVSGARMLFILIKQYVAVCWITLFHCWLRTFFLLSHQFRFVPLGQIDRRTLYA